VGAVVGIGTFGAAVGIGTFGNVNGVSVVAAPVGTTPANTVAAARTRPPAATAPTERGFRLTVCSFCVWATQTRSEPATLAPIPDEGTTKSAVTFAPAQKILGNDVAGSGIAEQPFPKEARPTCDISSPLA
jgi:hypothetical protein